MSNHVRWKSGAITGPRRTRQIYKVMRQSRIPAELRTYLTIDAPFLDLCASCIDTQVLPEKMPIPNHRHPHRFNGVPPDIEVKARRVVGITTLQQHASSLD